MFSSWTVSFVWCRLGGSAWLLTTRKRIKSVMCRRPRRLCCAISSLKRAGVWAELLCLCGMRQGGATGGWLSLSSASMPDRSPFQCTSAALRCRYKHPVPTVRISHTVSDHSLCLDCSHFELLLCPNWPERWWLILDSSWVRWKPSGLQDHQDMFTRGHSLGLPL